MVLRSDLKHLVLWFYQFQENLEWSRLRGRFFQVLFVNNHRETQKTIRMSVVKIVKALVIQFDYLAILLVPGLLDVAGANNPHPLPVFSILTSETVLFSKRITNSCPSYVP